MPPHICVQHLFCRGAAEARTALAMMIRQVTKLTDRAPSRCVLTHACSSLSTSACLRALPLHSPCGASSCSCSPQAHRGVQACTALAQCSARLMGRCCSSNKKSVSPVLCIPRAAGICVYHIADTAWRSVWLVWHTRGVVAVLYLNCKGVNKSLLCASLVSRVGPSAAVDKT